MLSWFSAHKLIRAGIPEQFAIAWRPGINLDWVGWPLRELPQQLEIECHQDLQTVILLLGGEIDLASQLEHALVDAVSQASRVVIDSPRGSSSTAWGWRLSSMLNGMATRTAVR